MTLAEMIRWVAFLRLEPRGDRRLDANVGWLVMNMRRLIGEKNPKFSESMLQFKHDVPNEEHGNTHEDNSGIKLMAEKMKAFVFSVKGGKKKP